MLSLGAFRYRNISVEHGGPIQSIQTVDFPVYGRRLFQTNVRLKDGLVPKRTLQVYSDADGTGADESPMVARHMAISEALERWAFHSTVRSGRRAQFAFDVDESSSGMAAFPGFSAKPARQAAMREALERACLLNWWEGRLEGERRSTPWDGVEALSFEPDPSITAVIVHGRNSQGFYSYGHAAAETFEGACQKAILEFIRHEWVMGCWNALGDGVGPRDRMERRAWYFSTPEGYRLFRSRIKRRANAFPSFDVLCDAEIPGPWSPYATVWRYVIKPPSGRFLSAESDFFFW